MAMITTVFSAKERGKGIGSHMSVIGAGGMAGPVLGGVLVSALGWRWVFLINFPLALIALAGALLLLDSKLFFKGRRGVRFDWPGATLSTGSLVTFLLLMTNGYRLGWGSPAIVVAGLLFISMLVGFIWWERRAKNPMLDLSLFANRIFSLGVLAGFTSFLSVGSVRFLMPFYLQGVLGFAPGQVGLIMLPTAVTMTIMGPIAGRLSDRFGYRLFNVAGLVLAAAGILTIARVSDNTPVWVIVAGLIAQSAGTGLFGSPNTASVFGAARSSRHGIVSALLSLVRNSANVTSVAIATTVVTATMVAMGFSPDLGSVNDGPGRGAALAFVAGINLLYSGMALLLLLGAVASFLQGPVGNGGSRTSGRIGPEKLRTVHPAANSVAKMPAPKRCGGRPDRLHPIQVPGLDRLKVRPAGTGLLQVDSRLNRPVLSARPGQARQVPPPGPGMR